MCVTQAPDCFWLKTASDGDNGIPFVRKKWNSELKVGCSFHNTYIPFLMCINQQHHEQVALNGTRKTPTTERTCVGSKTRITKTLEQHCSQSRHWYEQQKGQMLCCVNMQCVNCFICSHLIVHIHITNSSFCWIHSRKQRRKRMKKSKRRKRTRNETQVPKWQQSIECLPSLCAFTAVLHSTRSQWPCNTAHEYQHYCCHHCHTYKHHQHHKQLYDILHSCSSCPNRTRRQWSKANERWWWEEEEEEA